MKPIFWLFIIAYSIIGCTAGQNANAPVDLTALESEKKKLASEVKDLKRDVKKTKVAIKRTAKSKLTKSSKSQFYTNFSQKDFASFTFTSKHVGNVIKGTVKSSQLSSGKSPAHISIKKKGKK